MYLTLSLPSLPLPFYSSTQLKIRGDMTEKHVEIDIYNGYELPKGEIPTRYKAVMSIPQSHRITNCSRSSTGYIHCILSNALATWPEFPRTD